MYSIIHKLLLMIVLFGVLNAKTTTLNLPNKFDVKASDWWIAENGVKLSNIYIDRITSQPLVFHFENQHFHANTTNHLYYSENNAKWYFYVSIEGDLIGNMIKGKLTNKGKMYLDHALHYSSMTSLDISGEIDENGKVHLIDGEILSMHCESRQYNGEAQSWGALRPCQSDYWNKSILSKYKNHILLHLPVGELQSTQTPIKEETDTIEEDQEIDTAQKQHDTSNGENESSTI